MSKNTGTSELINYFDLGVNGNVGISGNLTLDTGSLNGTNAIFSSAVTASAFVYSGGTSSQFLKADGSLDSNVYALNSALGSYQLTADKGQPNGYASLDGNGKVPLNQINDALIGNVIFQGLWNASTNTPTLVDPPSAGTKGYYYIVSTGGTFAGITFEVGDWIISNGTAWGKVDNTDAVSSVFGRTGNIVASNGDYNTSQVTESVNLYYTDARARGALSFAAGSGAYNSSTGVITIPTNNNQIANGAGYITSAALSGYVQGSGSTNYLPKFTGASTIGNSLFTDNGINGAIGGENYSSGTGVRTFNITAGEYPGLVFWANNTTTGSIFSYTYTGNLFLSADPTNVFVDSKISFFIDNSERLAIFNNGNVSIANPPIDLGFKLDVNGTARVQGAATFDSSVTASSIIRSGGTSSQYLMADGSVSTLSNPVTGTGTTNYISKFTGSTTLADSLIYDNGSTVLIGTTTAPTPVTGVSFPLSITSSQATRVRIDSSRGAPNYANAGVGLYASGVQKWSFAHYSTDSGANYDFTIYNDALTSSAILVKGSNSNVLIGNPSSDNGAKLQVSGRLQVVGSFADQIRFGTNTSVYTNISMGSGFTTFDSIGGDSGAYSFRDDGQTRMFIDSSGNVGIGVETITASSGYKMLAINGSTGSEFELRGGGTAYGYMYANSGLVVLATQTSIPLVFQTAATERMRISSGGLVTVTGTGGRIVRIDGPSNTDNYLSLHSGTIEMFIDADSTNSSGIVGTQSGHNLILRTAGTNKVWVTPSGYVGIGTDIPDNKLAVWGSNNSLTSSQGNINVYTTNPVAIDTGGSIGLGGYYNTSNQFIPFANITGKKENSTNNNAAGYLAFLTRNNSAGTGERMRITSGGNVLIGTTTNSGEKLRVDGGIGVYGATVASGYSRALYVRGSQNVADDAFLTLTITNTSLIFIAENNGGTGALFFCSYLSGNINKISDPSDIFATSDIDGKLCIYKNSGADFVIIKNRLGSTKNITVSYIGVSD